MVHARWLRVAATLLLLVPCLAAQDGVSPSGIETIHKDVNEVNVTFTVTDHKGRFVNGLTQESFSILDDHHPPASVKRFQSMTDLPLRICIVIDTSSSIEHYVKFQQEVAIRFLKRVLRPAVDQACLVKFTSGPVLAQTFTGDLTKLEAGIRSANADGSTAVWDALQFTSRLFAKDDSADPTRNVIVLLSDGDDNSSKTAFDAMLQDLFRSETAVEVVDTFPVLPQIPRLQNLAKSTGGHFWSGESAKQLSASLAKIEQSLRSAYFVAYEPAGELAPGRFRRIEIKARRRLGKLAYRTGYFVPRHAPTPIAAERTP